MGCSHFFSTNSRGLTRATRNADSEGLEKKNLGLYFRLHLFLCTFSEVNCLCFSIQATRKHVHISKGNKQVYCTVYSSYFVVNPL